MSTSRRHCLIIDNYDSFTHNLVQAFRVLGARVSVFRNDALTLRELARRRWSHLVISPGPCTPREGGISVGAIRAWAGRRPILGVCLGHQAIGTAFGARLVPARRLMHGKTSRTRHDGRGLYRGLRGPFTAARYHSLALDPKTLPADLRPTAWTDDGELMGLRHKEWPLEGVQFHPESYMTRLGPRLLANFLKGD